MTTLTTDELRELLSNGNDVLLLNTLDEEPSEQMRISSAMNIPQSSDYFVERVEQVAGSKQRRVVVYGASQECDVSTRAAEKLEAAGFSRVYNYAGGAEAWQQAGEVLGVY